MGSFNYFSYTVHIGPNSYIDTGVRDLEVAFLRLILLDLMTYEQRSIKYAVLNTHNLDIILQLKYMPIVMNPSRIASSDWKS